MNSDRPTLICDIETYRDYFLAAFKRVSDGAIAVFEESSDGSRTFDRDRLRATLLRNPVVTYNGRGFDMPILFKACQGAGVDDLKQAADTIIKGNVRYWQAEQVLGTTVPRDLDHIDLIEPQPNAFASLKLLNGRLHGKRMQDLPYPPDARLNSEQMDEIRDYCINDLDSTQLLFEALEEPLAMRVALGKQYGTDFRSLSDAQIGESIIKRRVKEETGQWPEKDQTDWTGQNFPYRPPPWLRFDDDQLRGILDGLRETQFVVKSNGYVDLPGWLDGRTIAIGDSLYTIGIGGLHSNERHRAVHSDDTAFLRDYDVASYYPAIILGSGLYPKALGPVFLEVYDQIRQERIEAKRIGDTARDKGLKIALNGCYGKLGSPYSVLYAPHLMIAVTLTGQLALLMLIEWAEAAGIAVVSANTDGVVFKCPHDLEQTLAEVTARWERETGFVLESTDYGALYSQNVNCYIAVKPDGSAKRKGLLANPRTDGDMRGQLMNSPSMNICANAATAFVAHGIPIEETIYACKDVREFVEIRTVRGGARWRGEYLGKVVRFFWSTDGDPIYYTETHASTGNERKVAKTDGARPLMELPDDGLLPATIDFQRYVEAARQILADIGAQASAPKRKNARVFKYSRLAWVKASLVAV